MMRILHSRARDVARQRLVLTVVRTAAAALFVGASLAAATVEGPTARPAAVRAGTVTPLPDASVLHTAAPSTTTTAAPPSTTEPPPVTAAPVVAPAPRPVPRPTAPPVTALRPPPAVSPVLTGVDAYRGLGTWVDVYDWSRTYGGASPAVGVGDVDRMADVGVQTLYIQASKHDSPTDVLEPELLLAIVERAHQRGISVVAWYLPTLVDPAADLRRLLAIADLRTEGLAVDIEARNVSDVDERNRRLVQLSADLRQALPGRTIGGIVLPPVVLEVVNPSYWPRFPYREIAASYDVWQTMGYWTNRKADSGYRDAYRYTKENVERLRHNLGLPDALVHPIGGLAAETGPGDVDAYLRAAVETRSLGGSLYDWRTTRAETWPNQQGFRR